MQVQNNKRYFTAEKKEVLPSERFDWLLGFEQTVPPLTLMEAAVIEDTLKRVPFAVIVRGERYYKFKAD